MERRRRNHNRISIFSGLRDELDKIQKNEDLREVRDGKLHGEASSVDGQERY